MANPQQTESCRYIYIYIYIYTKKIIIIPKIYVIFYEIKYYYYIIIIIIIPKIYVIFYEIKYYYYIIIIIPWAVNRKGNNESDLLFDVSKLSRKNLQKIRLVMSLHCNRAKWNLKKI